MGVGGGGDQAPPNSWVCGHHPYLLGGPHSGDRLKCTNSLERVVACVIHRMEEMWTSTSLSPCQATVTSQASHLGWGFDQPQSTPMTPNEICGQCRGTRGPNCNAPTTRHRKAPRQRASGSVQHILHLFGR